MATAFLWLASATAGTTAFKEKLRLDVFLKKKAPEVRTAFSVSIQDALDAVYAKKSEPVKIIDKIRDRIKKRKYSEALVFCEKLKRDLRYRDYALYFEAEVYGSMGSYSLAHKNWAKAIEELNHAKSFLFEIGKDRPESPLLEDQAERAFDWEVGIAEAYSSLRQKEKAQFQLETAFERLSSGRLVYKLKESTLSFYVGLCKQSRSARCEAWMKKIMAQYPENSMERKEILEIDPTARNYKASLPIYERITKKYSVGDSDKKDLDEIFSLYFSESYWKAAERFDAFLKTYPKSSEMARARYWFGKTLQKIGDAKAAEFFFKLTLKESPLSFYGLSSAFLLGRNPQMVMSANLPMVETSDPNLSPRDLLNLSRAEELIGQKQLDLAKKELDQLKVKSFYSSGFCMYLATLQDVVGNHLLTYDFLTELILRNSPFGYSTHQVGITFSTPYLDEIKSAAAKAGVDSILLLSLVKQESSFDPEIRSSSGAMGLAQLMPYTALDIRANLYLRQAYDPELNLELGAEYLAKLLKQFNGNVPFALAAYNAGPNKLKSWLKNIKLEKLTLDEFIERIPYSETRNYVRSIVKNYFWYQLSLNGHALKDFGTLWIAPEATTH